MVVPVWVPSMAQIDFLKIIYIYIYKSRRNYIYAKTFLRMELHKKSKYKCTMNEIPPPKTETNSGQVDMLLKSIPPPKKKPHC